MKHIFTTLFIFTLLISPLTLQNSHAAAIQLPKTGQTNCYNESGKIIPCANTGQDGELQTGLAWPNPRFRDNGDQSVTDNLTGLIWTKDANLIKTHNPIVDAAGIPVNTGANWQQAIDYVKKLNTENYLGHNDWRLPNRNELVSLLNNGQGFSSTWLNGQGFTNVQSKYYWSATSNANGTNYAWIVSMVSGDVYDFSSESDVYNVWPVRSGQIGSLALPKTGQIACYSARGAVITCSGSGQDGELQNGTAWPFPRFTDNSISNSTEKTVTDNLTGLVWSKNANLAAATKTWQQALDYVKTLNSINFSGHNDWRLPNINELESMVNKGQIYPYFWLNGQGFTNVQSKNYWSATSDASTAHYAMIVDMNGGMVYGNGKTYDIVYVWPVRTGQSGAIDSLTLSVTKAGTGTGTVTSSPSGINCGATCSASTTTGTFVTLTATPASGSTFTGWTGACSGTGSCTVTMDVAKSVTATFAFSATNGACGSSNGGTFSIAPTANFCAAGTASAFTGSGPWGWTCTGINGGTTATCNASIQTYIILTSTVGSNGTVSCTSPTNSGATSTCTVTPSTGYQLSTLTDNSFNKFGAVAGGGYSIANVTANHTVVATFSDSQKPVVTTFTIPIIAPLTVPVTNLTATDNVAVSYCLTETNSSVGCSWSVTAPSNYTFTTAGAKTLYAWAKDATGNISLPVSAPVNVTSKPGDSDGDGAVSIAEVQSAINMFLGLKAAEACVDQDGVGGVSIAEVQKVINSFLGL